MYNSENADNHALHVAKSIRALCRKFFTAQIGITITVPGVDGIHISLEKRNWGKIDKVIQAEGNRLILQTDFRERFAERVLLSPDEPILIQPIDRG